MTTLDYAPSPRDWVREQVETYEASGGTEGADYLGHPVVIVTTVGVATGKARKSPLIRIEHDGQYAIVASNGGDTTHPAWYRNIVANPQVWLQDGPERHLYEAREARGEEYSEWWRRGVEVYDGFTGYIATAGDRVIPLFVLTRIEDAA
jgi:F420H(2)-dependent quinone reductase